MIKEKIILDCDPGHDDAVAILLLGSDDRFDVLGVSTVRGNQTIEKTTINAINVIDYLGLNYPVYKGQTMPLLRKSAVCSAIHGESGLDGFIFPSLKRQEEKKSAALFMVDTLLKNKNVTVVTTGPMTNLALALILEPKIREHIAKIVLMGGSIGAGNVTPAAEFNILTDPEAAKICFENGLPIYMVGLDVTRKCLVDETLIERMNAIHSKVSDMFVALMKTYVHNQKVVFNLNGGPLHDPLTIAYLIDPTILTFKPCHTEIDVSDGISAGRTNCDFAHYSGNSDNSFVATDVDVSKYWDLLEKSIRSYHD